jgi:polyisoprenoid-binding protein YceI
MIAQREQQMQVLPRQRAIRQDETAAQHQRSAKDKTMTNLWDIDVSHSAIHFWVRHMIISKVHGRFARWSGSIQLDEADLTRSSVAVSIDAASIDTQVADRDTHLKSPDFLDVAKYPQLTFSSKRIEKAGSAYRVVGDLDLHGVVREVTLEAEFAGTGKDPWGNQRAGFSAKVSLDRKDFGLTWNAALEAGGVLVGEKVEISIELEAVKKAAAAPVAV